MKEKNRAIRKKLNYSSEKIDVQYVVLADGQFIGGIYGNIQYDYLFINILFVDEDYRGLSIATKLMELIEEEAERRDVYNIYITTFEFQALDFYKKHGYKTVMVIDDFPVGFKEYTVYKKLTPIT
jgi:GNAT superfamily N-acetyltransferase